MNTLEARTGDLAWDTTGSQSRAGMVLIHSLGADSRMWWDQIPVFAEHRHLIWLDLPGHGSSSAAVGEYTVANLAADVIDVADTAGVERFDVCGISLGGVISLWMAANFAHRIESLIACNTGAKIGTEESWSQRIESVLSGGMASLREAVVPRFITKDLAERRPEAHELVYEMFDGIDPVGYAGCSAALRDADLRSVLGRIGSPTLLVGGTEDISTPPETMRALHRAVPGSRLRMIDGAAHLSNIDQPERFNEAIVEALG